MTSAFATAVSRSAEGITMNASLPPSSSTLGEPHAALDDDAEFRGPVG
jgi:hypothetical protein